MEESFVKTLVKNEVSIYLFEDSEVVNMKEDVIEVGDPIKFIIADCNSSNTTLIEGVTDPGDWAGHKYLYNGDWVANPSYVEPTEPLE
jgi:hypothetical protein